MTPSEYTRRLQEDIFLWLSRRTSHTGVQIVDEMSAAIGTELGHVRGENQDCAVIARYTARKPAERWTAFLLCDGIGGLSDGGICARKAVAVFLTTLVGLKGASLSTQVSNAANAANSEIFSIYRDNGGTTFSCLLINGLRNSVALNVGDSRIYRYTRDSVVQLSVDDTFSNQIAMLPSVQLGSYSPNLGRQLTQYIGMGPDIQLRELKTAPTNGTGYLLTSDGVHSLPGEVLNEITVCAPTASDVVKRLIAIARWGKGQDNASVVCAAADNKIGSSEPPFDTLAIWDSFARLDLVVDRSAVERSQGQADKLASGKRRSKRSTKEDPKPGAPDNNLELKIPKEAPKPRSGDNHLELKIIEGEDAESTP